jgi:integrase
MAKRKHVEKLGWRDGSIRQRGDKWQVRWRENGARQSKSGFDSRAEALDELERIRARLKLGQPGSTPVPTPIAKIPKTSIASLVEEWVQYRVRAGKRMALEEQSRWALHLARPLATQSLEGLTWQWVRYLAIELVKPTPGTKAPDGSPKEAISGPTAHRVLTLLSSFLTWCQENGHAKDNVARVALRNRDVKGLLRSTYDGKAAPYLKSWDQVMRLYKALAAPVAILYLVSARAGLRPGEVVALRWNDIDLNAKTITVARSVRAGEEGPTKSGKTRTVPIVDVLAKELAAWKKRGPFIGDNDLVCPPPVRKRRDGSAGSRVGVHLGPKSINRAMEAAFKTNKIPHATLYAYGRHTYGSLAGLGGISAWRLQEIMGHADIKTTQRYVSLKDQALTSAELRALGS